MRIGEVPKSLRAMFSGEKRRAAPRAPMATHRSRRYLEARRPVGRVTEFGDCAYTESMPGP